VCRIRVTECARQYELFRLLEKRGGARAGTGRENKEEDRRGKGGGGGGFFFF